MLHLQPDSHAGEKKPNPFGKYFLPTGPVDRARGCSYGLGTEKRETCLRFVVLNRRSRRGLAVAWQVFLPAEHPGESAFNSGETDPEKIDPRICGISN